MAPWMEHFSMDLAESRVFVWVSIEVSESIELVFLWVLWTLQVPYESSVKRTVRVMTLDETVETDEMFVSM